MSKALKERFIDTMVKTIRDSGGITIPVFATPPGWETLRSFMSAAKGDYLSVAADILSGDARLTDDIGNTSLHILMDNGKASYYEKERISFLVDACKESGIDVLAPAKNKDSVLSIACRNGNDTFAKDFVGDMTLEDFLQRDSDGNSIIHHLVGKSGLGDGGSWLFRELGKKAILLHGEAITNLRNDKGETPIMMCRDSFFVEELIASGGDISLTDSDGNDCITHWTRNLMKTDELQKSMKLIQTKGTLPKSDSSFFETASNGTLSSLKKILSGRKGENPDIRNSEGMTPFLLACSNRKFANAKELVKSGADVTLIDDNGNNAIHHLLITGGRETMTDRDNRKLLIETVLGKGVRVFDSPQTAMIPCLSKFSKDMFSNFDWAMAFSFADKEGKNDELMNIFLDTVFSNETPSPSFHVELFRRLEECVQSGTLTKPTLDTVVSLSLQKTAKIKYWMGGGEDRSPFMYHRLAIAGLKAGGDLPEHDAESMNRAMRIATDYPGEVRKMAEDGDIPEGKNPYDMFSQATKLKKKFLEQEPTRRRNEKAF